MELSRRNLMKGAGVVGVLQLAGLTSFAAYFLGSCGTLFQKILSYIGVGLNAFSAVVSLLSGAGVINIGSSALIDAAIALVQKGFTDLQMFVNQYDAAVAAGGPNPTLLQKISDALAVLESDIQQFWTDLTIPDAGLSGVVKGLLGIILSVLAGFATQLPAPSPVAVEHVAKRPRAIQVVPQKLSQSEFRAKFNSTLKSAGYGQHSI